MVARSNEDDVHALSPEQLQAAHDGSRHALGELLELCRQYLLAIANSELPEDLQGKCGASDLVQQSFLEAQRDFRGFAGTTRADLLRWLRRIMLNNVANVVRDYCRTRKRAAGCEVPLDGMAPRVAIDPGPSASSLLMAEERAQALQQAVSRLPEDYAQVIRWRNSERLSFEEIGQRLERSAEAARKLWVRALDQLREQLTSLWHGT